MFCPRCLDRRKSSLKEFNPVEQVMRADRAVFSAESFPFTPGWLQHKVWGEAHTRAAGAAEPRDG